MLKAALATLIVVATATPALWAAELHCATTAPRDPRQRAIVVDCSNAEDVAEKLLNAWQQLRDANLGLVFEDMCWRPYKQAQNIHPVIDPRDWSPGFLSRCNTALRYIR